MSTDWVFSADFVGDILILDNRTGNRISRTGVFLLQKKTAYSFTERQLVTKHHGSGAFLMPENRQRPAGAEERNQ
jgi:hypothetical protein